MDYDLENFSLLKTKLKTILRGFNLSKGNKTDVLLNFEKLKELEKQLWAIGMETRYESISPKINTSAIEIYPKDKKLFDIIRENNEHFDFFERLSYQKMYSVSFNHLLYSRDSDEDLNEAHSSIFSYLNSELKQGTSYLLEPRFGFEKTILNIVESAVRAVDRGSQKEKNFLAKLLFDFNLALVLFSPEMLERPKPELFDRLSILKPKNKLSDTPKIYTSSDKSLSKLVVTHVFSKDGNLVKNEDELKTILEMEANKYNESVLKMINKIF